jgi:hypothetical protein
MKRQLVAGGRSNQVSCGVEEFDTRIWCLDLDHVHSIYQAESQSLTILQNPSVPRADPNHPGV